MPAHTAIVTGANSGLGLGCAQALLAADPDRHVVLAVRDPARGDDAVRRLGQPGRCTVARLDLASLESVAQFTAAYAARGLPPLQTIVCNAGIQVTSDVAQLTGDGIEVTFAVNHLGHFALVAALLGELRPPARILIVASDTHDPRKAPGMPSPRYESAERLAHPRPGERVAGRRRYTTSKLCNVLFAYELDRRLGHGERGITVNAFNPGLMPGSGLARDASAIQRFAWHAILPALRVLPQVRSTQQSGRHLAALAGDPAYAATTGKYFDGLKAIASSRASYDTELARDLWSTSEDLTPSGLPRK